MSVAEVRAYLIADGKLLATGLIIAVVILAFDLITPLGVAGGVPYVILVLLCLWAKHRVSSYVMAATGTALTIVGYFFSPEGGMHWAVLTNRALAILVIWSVALFSAKRLAEIKGREIAEAKRHSLESRLSDVLRLSSEAIISVNSDGRIEFFNWGAESIFGYEAEEILGRPMESLMPESARVAHRTHVESFAQGPLTRRPMGARSELSGLRKDGSEFPAIISISKIEVDDEVLFTAIVHDISDRKKVEEQLLHAQKLESVGRLTGGIAHEFNNLLMVIFGNLEMIEDQLGEDDSLKELTSSALDGARRGAILTQGLLAFSRKQKLEHGSVDLNGIIHNMQQLFQKTLGETIKVRVELEEGLWPVLTDPGQIEATLLNLVVNASDAMPKGGTITLRTSNRTIDEDIPHLIDILPPGDYCALEVIDTGIGMASDVKQHAFEPFYTTKDVGKGTGLGLSMVYGFAKQSGGHVEFVSEAGKGTTMRLYLPRSKEQQRDVLEEADQFKKTRNGGGTILVLEDDSEVRALAVIQLTALGYEVIEAEDGLTALAILEERSDIDLLFADMVLSGGKSGPEIVQEAREKYPNLRAVFVTGYYDKHIVNLNVDGNDIAILRKPYVKSELAKTIAAVMNSD